MVSRGCCWLSVYQQTHEKEATELVLGSVLAVGYHFHHPHLLVVIVRRTCSYTYVMVRIFHHRYGITFCASYLAAR